MLKGIVVLIAVLSIVAVVMFGLKGSPEYKNENAPEAVVHDFILAMNNEDYEKAFEFIYADIEYGIFLDNFSNEYPTYNQYMFFIQGSEIEDDQSAHVSYQYSSGFGDLIGDSYRYSETVNLTRDSESGDWKIQEMYPYHFLFEYYYEAEPIIIER